MLPEGIVNGSGKIEACFSENQFFMLVQYRNIQIT